MKRNPNTAILLILRAHMITHKVIKSEISVPLKECVQAEPAAKASDKWVGVPDIVSAMWVVGELST